MKSPLIREQYLKFRKDAVGLTAIATEQENSQEVSQSKFERPGPFSSLKKPESRNTFALRAGRTEIKRLSTFAPLDKDDVSMSSSAYQSQKPSAKLGGVQSGKLMNTLYDRQGKLCEDISESALEEDRMRTFFKYHEIGQIRSLLREKYNLW